jgi:hypothetical protein
VHQPLSSPPWQPLNPSLPYSVQTC